ncbi:serine hydrolase domain-containing protein [Acanthopleuribacter pedis]|uniref:Serine hydrolase n=1 Tax=Acanthopleuribacter pedis TaxID=442870 RepID=A0A8J7QP89_9BACT|nr:serine hydrolase [Acanthopleuribacter pedis]MBO1322118.1 serine hydrolase [Acanthopleuribacter pedis]
MTSLLFLSCLLVWAAPTPITWTPDLVETRWDPYLKAGVAQGFSGAVLAGQGEAIVFARGYGLADRENNRAFSPDTVVTVGSVTKQFTAAAILTLVEKNKLTTDDPLSRFFKDLPADKQKITVHQLLTHASGLRALPDKGDWDMIPRDSYFKQLFAGKLAFTPGARYQYSNAGYSVLGRIIEIVSGQSYEAYLRQHLFLPAGMQHTGYLLPDWKGAPLAKGYFAGVVPVGTMIGRFQQAEDVSWVLKGNGGIQSTLHDMFRWYLALRNHKVLSARSTEILTTPYIPEGPNTESHYAYGWAIFNSPRDTKVVTHNGGNRIFFFDFIWLAEEDAVVLFCTNATSRQTEVSFTLERMLFDADFQPDPIKSNPTALVLNFSNHHPLGESAKLFKQIQARAKTDFQHPEVLNRVGYLLLDLPEKQAWAVEVFKMNTQLFPKDGNAWDSLGEGQLALGDKAAARKSYQKAVALGFKPAAKTLKKLN